jgi:hypothetical protein
MNDYRENMFFIPLLHIEVRDWNIKKTLLKKISSDVELKKLDKVYTDFGSNQKINYIDEINEILKEEIDLFKSNFSIISFRLLNAWFEKSKNQDYHPPHIHNKSNYSAVCYIDYDNTEHTPTNFISPFNNLITNDIMHYKPRVTEGSLIFFPSKIIHYTDSNTSKKDRLILSFNIEVEVDND